MDQDQDYGSEVAAGRSETEQFLGATITDAGTGGANNSDL